MLGLCVGMCHAWPSAVINPFGSGTAHDLGLLHERLDSRVYGINVYDHPPCHTRETPKKRPCRLV